MVIYFRRNNVRRLYLEKALLAAFIIIIYLIYTYNRQLLLSNKTTAEKDKNITINTKKLHYILLWSAETPLHIFKKKGQTAFIKNRCKFRNCYTVYKLKNITDLRPFDAIVFSVDTFSAFAKNKPELPEFRIRNLKYVFASTKSATYAEPVTEPIYDDFFNWTWTYRLDSDILWRHFVIYDTEGREIGPSVEPSWLESLEPTSDRVTKILRSKSRFAAWLLYSCQAPPDRRAESYVFDLQQELDKHNLTVEVYGPCRKDCGTLRNCANVIKNHYYFYLAFEDSFDEDYVSYGLLNAVNNYALPVVMGGANYTRFLPPNSYIDATNMNVSTLVATMRSILSNFTVYQDYFRWTNHYTYKMALQTEVCNLCEAVNTPHMINTFQSHETFRKWWWTGTNERKKLFELINRMYSHNMLDTIQATYNKLVQDSLYMY